MRLLRWLIPVLLLVSAFGINAQDAPEPPILAVLASAPDTANARQWLSYADYQALTEGATTAEAWFDAVISSLSSGPDMSYARMRMSDQELLTGVAMLDVAQGATWGQPPEHTVLLQGAFNPLAITTIYALREFSANPAGELTMFCGPDGCDSGYVTHIDARNPGDPFGGELGRQQPVLLVPLNGESQLVSSPDLPTLEASAAAISGEAPSLAEAPDYQAAVHTLTDASTLLQAYFLSPDTFSEPAEAGELAIWSLAVLAETETDDGRGASITLIYPSLADAEAAAPALEARLETTTPGRSDQPFAAVLKERGVLFSVSTLEDSETGLGVIQMAFEPLEGEGTAFMLLVNSLNRRELDWLTLP